MKRKLAAALSLVFASATQATTVFINELHYDNSGADTGEFVEIAAPQGTDLSGWSVVLYNGSNGTEYASLGLGGVVPNSGNGYGFIVVSPSSIQNGSPDGLALVDNSGNVVQFLSYEGSLTASDGPAAGLTSDDIGVSEPGSTPVGFSLQLSGSGTQYSDFIWQDPAGETRGSVNNAQSFNGDVVDNAPTVTITPADGATNVSLDANIELAFSEPVVLSAVGAINCTSDVAITVTTSGEGLFYTLNPDQNFASADQCSFTLRATDVTDLDGTPDNLAEDITINFSVLDTSATIEFVLNEIHADPASDITGDANADGSRDSSQDEFVELVNVGELATDISGWTISDGFGVRHTFPEGSIVQAGCAAVVFGGGAPDGAFGGALVQVASGGSLGLNNGGDSVTLSNGVFNVEASYSGSQGGNNQSITLSPDVVGQSFEQHSTIEAANGALFSPGTQLDGTLFSGCEIPDVAPVLIDVTPADGATNVSVDTEIVFTFSEDIQLFNAPLLNCSVSGTLTPSATVNGATLTLAPNVPLASNEQCSISLLANSIADIDGTADTLVSDITLGFSTASVLACNSPNVTMISAVQGSGDESPLDGQNVVIQASVTAILPEWDAFVVQEEAFDQDGDATTSEGVFVVNTGNGFTMPAIGDVIAINGNVSERFGRTQVTLAAEPVVCGSDVIQPTPFTLPLSAEFDLEWLEGMLITSTAPLTVTDNFSLGRFGRLTLSSGRLFTPTNVTLPGSPEYNALVAANALDQIVLDDASDDQNRDIVPFPTGNLSADNTVRLGDTVASLTGVLDFTRGIYMVYATDDPVFVDTNPRTSAPDLAPGNLKIASLNVLNYFNNIDTGASICGPGTSGCRGAEDNGVDGAGRSEFERQKLKTVAALVAMDADIVGLMEIENNGFSQGSAIADLVEGINAVMGENTYQIVDAGGPVGTDAITVALIYKPEKVNLVGDLTILSSANSIADANGPLFDDSRNRPSHIQKFALVENGEEIVVSVNHLKSKGSGCGVGDDDISTGQGNCNLTRTRAAQALTAFLADNFGDTPTLIIGDLNAYALEDPIRAILSEGYTDLANLFGGAQTYSYSFGGEIGYLDHALASTSLLDKVVDTAEWHINADEPIVLDYNLNFQSPFQQDNLYAPDPYRMSDHDPVLVSIQLDAPAILGDWDGDGDVDVLDFKLFIGALILGQDISLDFDLNGDGIVNREDARILISLCTRTRCRM